MKVWSAEIKELQNLHESFKGQLSDLEKELEQLIRTEDANVIMLYSRRCLEVIIIDLCECELNRPRKTEPLKGIIDKLNKEEKVPSHIITSMLNLNSLSVYGTHPKEFDPRQVKSVLNNLTTIIEWYLKYKNIKYEVKAGEPESERPDDIKEPILVVKPKNKSIKVISGILIITLIVISVFDVFNIFKKDKFEDIRDADGRISIVVMPFHNITGDTLYEGMELGLQNLLITRLSNSDELSVRQMQTMGDILGSTRHLNYASITPSIASDIALKLDANTVILGSIHKSGKNLRITANFLDSRSEEIYKSFEIDGDSEDDFFTITDSLTILIKNHLEIKVLEQDIDQDIRLLAETVSAEAYRYFSKGLNKFYTQDFEVASDLFETALEIDPDFFSTAMFLIGTYVITGNSLQARQLTEIYYRQVDHYKYYQQVMIKYWKSYFEKNMQESIKYAKLLLEEQPLHRIMWFTLGLDYFQIKQYRDAIKAFEKAQEIDRKWGGEWKWVSIYVDCGRAYHETGQHTREKEIYKLGLGTLPDHPMIIFRQAVCALSLGDTTVANEYIEKYRSIREIKGHRGYDIIFWIGMIYQEAEQFDKAMAIFRDLIVKYLQDPLSKRQLGFILIENEINVDEGMELIQKALEIEPDNPNLLWVKGWGCYKQGKFEEALDILKESWEARPYYNHDHYLLLQEVEQALVIQNK